MDDDAEDPDRTDSMPGLPPPAADPEVTQADLTAGIESLRASWDARHQEELRALREAVESRERMIAALRDALAARDAEIAALARLRADAPPRASADRAAPAPASGPRPALIRRDGGGETVCVLGRRTRIGRAEASELHIDSASVSRHHALVLMGPKGVIIEDLNSTNGVYVNGRKVARQRLRDGDAVTIGEAEFRFTGDP